MKTRLLISAATLTVSTALLAQHKAHEHGAATLDIAIEGGKKVSLDFNSPADSIYGFEHEAKSEKDKKAMAQAVETFKAKILEMAKFDAKSGCTVTSSEINPRVVEAGEKNHASVDAEFKIACKESLAGTKITFGFSKIFPHLKSVKVQLVSDAKQTGVTIKKDKGELTL